MANPLTLNLIGPQPLEYGDPSLPPEVTPENRIPIHAFQSAIKAYCHGNWYSVDDDTPAERWAAMVQRMEDWRINVRGGTAFSTGTGSERSALQAYENKVNNRLNGTPPVNMTQLEWALQFCEEIDSNLLLGEVPWIDADTVEQWTLAP